MAKPQDMVLTIGELADYPKLSKSTLYHVAWRGDLQGQKLARRWRVHKATIDRWLVRSSKRPLNRKINAADTSCPASRRLWP